MSQVMCGKVVANLRDKLNLETRMYNENKETTHWAKKQRLYYIETANVKINPESAPSDMLRLCAYVFRFVGHV